MKRIAIGTNNGELQLRRLDAINDKLIAQYKVSDNPISLLGYSPNNDDLIIASQEDLYICTVMFKPEQFKGKEKHTTPIKAIDFTTDGNHVRTMSENMEFLYWYTVLKKFEDDTRHIKEKEWASESCKIGAMVEGVIPAGVPGRHIRSVCRSELGLAYVEVSQLPTKTLI